MLSEGSSWKGFRVPVDLLTRPTWAVTPASNSLYELVACDRRYQYLNTAIRLVFLA